jgi:tRNA pseudouridine13 synthase
MTPTTSGDISSPTRPQPIATPLVCNDLTPLDARLGGEPEDFVVDEVPAYLPTGTGTHLYLRVRKRLMNTQDLLHHLAQAAGVNQSELGSAGMKDRHAVTTQWVSLPANCRPTAEWRLPDGVEILEQGLHTNKLRTGHLIGNRFTLTLVDASDDDHSRFDLLWQRLERGMYNGYGAQRFGHNGDNLGRALQWASGAFALKGPKARFYKKLYPSVIQAELFNRYLIERLARSLEQPLSGEVVRLSGSGARFVVKDSAGELTRWQSRDIVPMGPMVGSKLHPSLESDALELQHSVVATLFGTPELPERVLSEAPGTHRDLLLFLKEPAFEWLNNQRLQLSFELPAGAYATEVLRELTRVGRAT